MNCGGSASNNYSHRPLRWDASLTDRKNLTLGAGPADQQPFRRDRPCSGWLGLGKGKERSVLRDAKGTLQFNKALQLRPSPTPTHAATPNTARYRQTTQKGQRAREPSLSTAPAFPLAFPPAYDPSSKNTDSSKTTPSLRNPLSPTRHTTTHHILLSLRTATTLSSILDD